MSLLDITMDGCSSTNYDGNNPVFTELVPVPLTLSPPDISSDMVSSHEQNACNNLEYPIVEGGHPECYSHSQSLTSRHGVSGMHDSSVCYDADADEETDSQVMVIPTGELPCNKWSVSDLEAFRDEPRLEFIEKVLELTNSDITDLETLKIRLFKIAKKRADFPCKEGYLKRRLDTWNKGGKPLEKKLAKDCIIMYRATA